MINRFTSRLHKLDQTFLTERLRGALAYDRIAGYFSSSILEVAGEALESVQGPIRVICNSDLQVQDVETARAAQYGMRREWCASGPEKFGEPSQGRFQRLYRFLRDGKLQVKVLPNDKFGLIHGKAGVITLGNGSKTAFLGSVNETFQAWKLNYEILWEDNSPEAVAWVQEEFDALWQSPYAVKLADFVIEDIGRLARRTVVPSVEKWRQDPEPAAPVIETPVYRQEYGLWEHQKYFVKLAFDAHRGPFGARYLLADMVGLGKTVQLALVAMLMALHGDGPILVLAPKALVWQWQDEMRNLLGMPAAVWAGKKWVDEYGIDHPVLGPEGVLKCPRRVGIVSTGLITSVSEVAEYLLRNSYECVILDEAHRARRKNLGPTRAGERPDPNNLLAFMDKIAGLTRSLFLATATPVQIYPVEVWDLMTLLAKGNEFVFGNAWSQWRQTLPAMEAVMGRQSLPEDERELWHWVRNPLPPASEHPNFSIVRQSLGLGEEAAVAPGSSFENLMRPDKDRLTGMRQEFAQNHNPFIRHIVRRTREFLESTIDPGTHEPYLKPVKVELFGEDEAGALLLPAYLQDAYNRAEDFCRLLGSRISGSGFLRTHLLRRVGSTIYAGRKTADAILQNWEVLPETEVDEEEDVDAGAVAPQFRTLTQDEKGQLQSFIDALDANQERDPKYQRVIELLLTKRWLDQGCIIFSQWFDSIEWLAQHLSGEDLPGERIGIYAGAQRSGVMIGGEFRSQSREALKKMVRTGEVRLLLGTDAASEGLNLQRLGTLINLDLPWNPTRLEQRKGRIQRIGQLRDTVFVYNMRYRGSVEDRVHQLLSARLKEIFDLFGQIPDVLEDVWIQVALGEIEEARQTIDALPRQHPFEIRYHQKIGKVNWESCAQVLDAAERRKFLSRGW
ncbi:MAG: helicase SNF2 [Deltaproteobacteria bacterium]|nr:helicase SNF2 [Deltaproteobacteria bacterium]